MSENSKENEEAICEPVKLPGLPEIIRDLIARVEDLETDVTYLEAKIADIEAFN